MFFWVILHFENFIEGGVEVPKNIFIWDNWIGWGFNVWCKLFTSVLCETILTFFELSHWWKMLQCNKRDCLSPNIGCKSVKKQTKASKWHRDNLLAILTNFYYRAIYLLLKKNTKQTIWDKTFFPKTVKNKTYTEKVLGIKLSFTAIILKKNEFKSVIDNLYFFLKINSRLLISLQER